MIYCTHCGKEVDEARLGENNNICPHCGGELILDRELEYDETRDLNKALHNRLNKARENFDNAMVFVVLGATFLILGVLFLMLSKRMNYDTWEKEITSACPEFWVAMVGLVFGGAGLIYGIVRVIIEKISQGKILKRLRTIQNNNYVHLANLAAAKRIE